MGTFLHHPDGYIKIDDFMYPLSEFLIDEPGYGGLPQGAIGHEYVQGVRNSVFNSDSILPVDSEQWADGDTYISKKSTYQAAYAGRTQS